jgi:hypothetical protein
MPFFLEVQYNSPRETDRIQWADSLAGPWESAAEAARFAASECGLPWRVVDDDFEQNQIEYASGNLDQPPPTRPHTRNARRTIANTATGRGSATHRMTNL